MKALSSFMCVLSCASAMILSGTSDAQSRSKEAAAAFTPWVGAGIGAFELAEVELQPEIQTVVV